MKIETILNALEIVCVEQGISWQILDMKRGRQIAAFRARILRTAAIYRNFAEANGFDKEQAWFWTDEWQAGEKEVDRLIAKGEIHSFDSMAEFLETLEVDND